MPLLERKSLVPINEAAGITIRVSVLMLIEWALFTGDRFTGDNFTGICSSRATSLVVRRRTAPQATGGLLPSLPFIRPPVVWRTAPKLKIDVVLVARLPILVGLLNDAN